MSDINPYEDACEAYEIAIRAAGYTDPADDNAAFEDAHSVAIGAAVEAAVKAECKRVLAELAPTLAMLEAWRKSCDRQLRTARGTTVMVNLAKAYDAWKKARP